MPFTLKHKKYFWLDFIGIPLQSDQSSTIVFGILKLLNGLSAVIQIPIVAKLINSAVLSAQGKAQFSSTLVWFILFVVCIGWRRISSALEYFFREKLQIVAKTAIGLALTDKRAKLKYHHYENAETWNLIERVCKQPEINASMMVQHLFDLFIYIIRIFGVLYIITTQVWWIGVLASIIFVPLILLSLKGGSQNYEAYKKASKFDRRHKYLSEVLTGRNAVDERALFNFSDHVSNVWNEYYKTACKIRMKADTAMLLKIRFGNIFATVLSSVITIALVFPTASGQISIGMFFALATSVYDLIILLGVQMSETVTQLSRLNAYLKDLTEFAGLDETIEAIASPSKNSIEFLTLEMKNVSFSYPGKANQILKKINLEIKNGGHYAFVGANGAGKTTITKLLTGLYDNYEGEILLNGKELKLYTQGELKAIFAGLYQDFAKYSITVRENVCVGTINEMYNPELKNKINQILTTVGVYDELAVLPKGFETPLGKIFDGGTDISGGQWQKLAMARTLINPAPILILDEPTASLDPVSESRLYEQFEHISKGRTSIFISHRLGSTKLADTIFVLENGEVSEQGSHEKLMEKKKTYARMYESQRSWYQ